MINFMNKLKMFREYKIPTYGELLQSKLQVRQLYSVFSDIVVFFGNMKIEFFVFWDSISVEGKRACIQWFRHACAFG